MSHKIPKIIWFLWLQGLNKAPNVVKKCYSSWEKHNPNWKIIFLDNENYKEFIDIKKITDRNSKNMSPNALSDVIRINLLSKHGGVWTDATCFCCIPLDNWLDNYTQTEFFAFSRPAKDRIISSWFLASSNDNYIIKNLCEKTNSYWQNNTFLNLEKKNLIRKILGLMKRLTRLNTSLWFSFVIRKVTKTYSYFWLHYLFEYIHKKNKLFKKLWDKTPKYSADFPHKVMRNLLIYPIPDNLKKDIDEKKEPLYKLSWKYDSTLYKKGCTLDYLLNSGKE